MTVDDRRLLAKPLGKSLTITLATLTAAFTAVLLYVVLGLDDWLGVLAFKYQYLGFCALVSGSVAVAWLLESKRLSMVAGLTVLALLMSPYLVSKPSSRILREILIEVGVGSGSDEVERAVKAAYKDSGFVMPRVTTGDERILVSLLTQASGDCTAAIFYLQGGTVVGSEFSAD